MLKAEQLQEMEPDTVTERLKGKGRTQLSKEMNVGMVSQGVQTPDESFQEQSVRVSYMVGQIEELKDKHGKEKKVAVERARQHEKEEGRIRLEELRQKHNEGIRFMLEHARYKVEALRIVRAGLEVYLDDGENGNVPESPEEEELDEKIENEEQERT